MKNLRKVARGRPCTMRAPGCDGGGETTVLAHIRRGNIAGIGQKPDDVCGFWACSKCHDLYDRRSHHGFIEPPTNELLDSMALRALVRTLTTLRKEGLL